MPVKAGIMINIDIKNIEGTRCYCDDSAAENVRAVVAESNLSDVHYIGSGDFHYITLFELERIREPFSLLLIDKHSDAQEGAFGNAMLSCGNWVIRANGLPYCRGIIHPETADSPVDPAEGIPVYVSIDLDAMSPEFAETNWDQGSMSTDDVCRLILKAAGKHRIIGADICGAPAGDVFSELNQSAIRRLSDVLAPYISKTAEV